MDMNNGLIAVVRAIALCVLAGDRVWLNARRKIENRDRYLRSGSPVRLAFCLMVTDGDLTS